MAVQRATTVERNMAIRQVNNNEIEGQLLALEDAIMAILYVFWLKRCHSRQLPSMGTVFTTNDRCSCKHVDPSSGSSHFLQRHLPFLADKVEVIVWTHPKTISYLESVVNDYEEETE